MKPRLDLTEEQAAQVKQILTENLKDIQALRAQFRPRLVARILKVRNDLDAVLTPEQSRKLDQRLRHFLKYWQPPGKNARLPEPQQ